MNGLNETPAADATEPVIYEPGSVDLTGNPANDAEAFTGERLAEPTDDVAPPPLPDKPVIRITRGSLHEHIAQAQKVLSDAGAFTQGNHLVRVSAAASAIEIADETKRHEIKRDPTANVLIGITQEYAREKLTECALFQRRDERSKTWVNDNCPHEIAAGLVNRGSWDHIRPLKAVVSAPFVRADGSICATPGYDAQSQAFCRFDPDEFPTLPEQVSKEEAVDALAVLRAVFDQFPFSNPASESAFLAHILTEAARLAMPHSPMFWYSAQYSGTGKTLLSGVAACIVHGVEPAARPWTDGEELRKTLFASLLAGDRSVRFDNIPKGVKVRSPILCAYLTAEYWQDRKLGDSDTPRVANASVVVATGNNVTPVDDLARRSLVIRMDANMKPSALRERAFRIEDLPAYLREHRKELLMATLIIIRGHQQSGHKGPTPLPGFVAWSHHVRDALLWLGMSDPCDSQKQETDRETSNIDDAFTALADVFGDKPFMSGEISARVNSMLEAEGKLATTLAAGGVTDPHDTQRVGYWLREHRDHFGGGFKLAMVSTENSSARKWRLVYVTPAPAPVPTPAYTDLV